MLSRCFLEFSMGVGAFVTGLSQISYFFSCEVAIQSKAGMSLIILYRGTSYVL